MLKTVAQSGEGIEELWRTLDRHRVYLESSGELSRRRQARLEERVRAVVERRLQRSAKGGPPVDPEANPTLVAAGPGAPAVGADAR